MLLSVEEVKSLLDYDPLTGLFSWKIKYFTLYPGKPAGSKGVNGYLSVCIKRKNYYLHRLAFYVTYGYMPEIVDHINCIRSDNRILNLRETDIYGNNQNTKVRKNNKSGVKGVYWHAATKKWAAVITVKRKSIHLGCFATIEQAKKARREAAEKYQGIFVNHG